MSGGSTFDKPFTDIKTQIKILKDRNLRITDEVYAAKFLENYGYYELINGNKLPFLDSRDPEVFIDGTEFTDLVGHYFIDAAYRRLFLTAILPIENHFKTLIGFQVAENFGVCNYKLGDPKSPDSEVQSYLYPDNYVGKSKNHMIWRIHNKVLTVDKDPIRYYRENHNHIPPWVLMSNMMLGDSIMYYRILPEPLREKIDNLLVPKTKVVHLSNESEIIAAALDVLRQFRNCSAHSSPLNLAKATFQNNGLTLPLKIDLIQYTGNSVYDGLSHQNGINDLFGAFIFLVLLTTEPQARGSFIQNLTILDQSYRNGNISKSYKAYLKQTNMPSNYIERLDYLNNNL